jgi:release factor glutamine methyltransferase
VTNERPTIGEFLRLSTEELERNGSERSRLDAERLVAHAVGLDRVGLYLHLERPLTRAEVDRARELVRRRAAREPLQYVLGEWGFRRLTLRVDRRALIPRPETETVVERCLALIAALDAPRVLDVGTGTGAIALAIADEHPGALVTGIDISDDALALAVENAARTGVTVELRHHDLFAGLPGGDWDLVVSNPPYVRRDELVRLAPEVVDWEPQVALVANGQTEALVRDAATVMRPGGALVLEAHEESATAVASLLVAHGYHEVAVTEDLAGRRRVVEGRA